MVGLHRLGVSELKYEWTPGRILSASGWRYGSILKSMRWPWSIMKPPPA